MNSFIFSILLEPLIVQFKKTRKPKQDGNKFFKILIVFVQADLYLKIIEEKKTEINNGIK